MNTTTTERLWDNPLVRHLAIVLLVKVLLLTVLWWLFFRMPDSAVPTPVDVHTHIAGPRAGGVSTLTD